ncbi:hypothetical protein D1164_21930 [Mariniphaga sediminis]|uniref:Uncharacterized protein n=1 Tax=Mariniphaga sediminis TaxID=1628158 RepID=A0A399CUN5_9BACT|nr:hypothetical protein D1164_21930 [Mariniphaga sediminis]
MGKYENLLIKLYLTNRGKNIESICYPIGSIKSLLREPGFVSSPPRTFNISVAFNTSIPLKFLFSFELKENLFIVNKFNSLNLKNTHSIYIFRKTGKGNPQIEKKMIFFLIWPSETWTK